MATHQSITHNFSSQTHDWFLHLHDSEFQSFSIIITINVLFRKMENHINRFHSSNTCLQTAILPSGSVSWDEVTIATNSSPKSRHFGVSFEKNFFFSSQHKVTFALSGFFYVTSFLFLPASSRLYPTRYVSIVHFYYYFPFFYGNFSNSPSF